MPRTVEETWTNVQFGVEKVDLPKIDPADGQPLHDAHGLPLLEAYDILVLTMLGNDVSTRVKVPFDQESKQKLVRMFTGGILIPENGSVPPGMPPMPTQGT